MSSNNLETGIDAQSAMIITIECGSDNWHGGIELKLRLSRLSHLFASSSHRSNNV